MGRIDLLDSRDLIELAKEWVRPPPELQDHFAIVRRLWPESDRLPQELRDVWHEAGPRRAHRALATYLAALGARYRPGGGLEFLGRADHQVKVRGHRGPPQGRCLRPRRRRPQNPLVALGR